MFEVINLTLRNHKKLLIPFSIISAIILIGIVIFSLLQKTELISPLSPVFIKVNYTPFSFESLKKREYYPNKILFEKVLKEEENYTSYLFSFASDGRRITGMANLPKKEGKLPVAILLRGWVDEEIYQPGMGTDKMATFLAGNGFLTLAPDFLGYGGSDNAFPDMLQTRFFRPITVITLLQSIVSLPQADPNKVVFWAHSNGGQIALSVLEITNKEIPTSLWAPVSASFPESILHYASEMEDEGKMIRKVVGEFEKEYDVSQFSIDSFFEEIKAPLIIHQGTADEAIPMEWTEELIEELDNLDKEVTYHQYPGENHNFHYGSAPLARQRDLLFFRKHLSL